MRIVLEVSSGASAGRKALLGAGQVLQVGRTEWADLSVPQDGHMSGKHFALQTDEVACYLTDLGSSNGTLLNGLPVADRAVLRNGDQIQAGKTVFLVRTEGDAPEKAQAAAAAAGPLPAPLSPGAAKVFYTVETCDSGLTLCRGSVDDVPPAQLAALAGRKIPPFLIVDLKRLEAELPDGIQPAEHVLFDWMEPSAAAQVSPLVFSAQELPDWPALIEQGWGGDAVICLFSGQQKPELLAHLRRCIRQPGQADSSSGIVGYCWPSVMAPLLSHSTPESVERILTGIEAVMVELPDLPETWQIYGRDSAVVELLDQLGLVQQPPEEVAAQPTEDQN